MRRCELPLFALIEFYELRQKELFTSCTRVAQCLVKPLWHRYWCLFSFLWWRDCLSDHQIQCVSVDLIASGLHNSRLAKWRQLHGLMRVISNLEAAYLIFVTGTTGGARGEKICHMEKCTWRMWRNLKFLHMWINFTFLHMTVVEKSEISPNVGWFQIASHDSCG